MRKNKVLLVFSLLCFMLSITNFSPATVAAAGERIGNFQTQNLLGSNNDDRAFSITMLAEGYTESEQGTFIKDAQGYVDYLKTVSPYNEFINYINVHAIKVISQNSGICRTDEETKTRKTYFESFVNNEDALISSSNASYKTAEDVALSYFENTDAIVVICNKAPSYARATALRSSGKINLPGSISDGTVNGSVFIHELGHFFNLEDEYNRASNGEGWNVTKENNFEKVKWRWFFKYASVGLVPIDGNRTYLTPCKNCIMKSSANEYCPVCKYLVRRNLIANITNADIGDLNQDNSVNSADLTIMRAYLLHKREFPTDPIYKEIVDINNDGRFDSGDYTTLKRCLMDINGTGFLIDKDYYLRFHNGSHITK